MCGNEEKISGKEICTSGMDETKGRGNGDSHLVRVARTPSTPRVNHEESKSEIEFFGSTAAEALCVIPPPCPNPVDASLLSSRPSSSDDDIHCILETLDEIWRQASTRQYLEEVVDEGTNLDARKIQAGRFEVFVRSNKSYSNSVWRHVLNQHYKSMPKVREITDKVLEYAKHQAGRDPRIGKYGKYTTTDGWKFGSFSLILTYEQVPAQEPHIDLLAPHHQFGLMLTHGGAPSTLYYEIVDGSARRISNGKHLVALWKWMDALESKKTSNLTTSPAMHMPPHLENLLLNTVDLDNKLDFFGGVFNVVAANDMETTDIEDLDSTKDSTTTTTMISNSDINTGKSTPEEKSTPVLPPPPVEQQCKAATSSTRTNCTIESTSIEPVLFGKGPSTGTMAAIGPSAASLMMSNSVECRPHFSRKPNNIGDDYVPRAMDHSIEDNNNSNLVCGGTCAVTANHSNIENEVTNTTASVLAGVPPSTTLVPSSVSSCDPVKPLVAPCAVRCHGKDCYHKIGTLLSLPGSQVHAGPAITQEEGFRAVLFFSASPKKKVFSKKSQTNLDTTAASAAASKVAKYTKNKMQEYDSDTQFSSKYSTFFVANFVLVFPLCPCSVACCHCDMGFWRKQKRFSCIW